MTANRLDARDKTVQTIDRQVAWRRLPRQALEAQLNRARDALRRDIRVLRLTQACAS